MFDELYLIEDKKNKRWYLRTDSTFACLSCADSLDHMKENVVKLIKKYKTDLRLEGALRDTEGGGKIMSSIEQEYQREIFRKEGHKHKDLLHELVKGALEEVKNDTPLKRSKKLFKKVNIEVSAPLNVAKQEILDTKPLKAKVIKPLAKRPLKRLQVD
jgi:hypothetical protein